MPLNKSSSNAARSQNIATEIAAGKPPKQAIAIGFSVQRNARGMANGGMMAAKQPWANDDPDMPVPGLTKGTQRKRDGTGSGDAQGGGGKSARYGDTSGATRQRLAMQRGRSGSARKT